ncbi:ABC transporter permease [Streptococcus sp.]
MKKKPIYLYILLFFSTVGTLTSAVATFGASKNFELTDDFANQLGLTTAQDKADYLVYFEKSVQVNQSPLAFLFVSLIIIALLATFYFLFMKQDLLTAHYTYMGQIVLSQAFSFYNYFVGRSLLATFSNPSLRQRYLVSSSLALLLLTVFALLFFGIILYKTLRLRKAQATA